jgi:hypothetical protein
MNWFVDLGYDASVEAEGLSNGASRGGGDSQFESELEV